MCCNFLEIFIKTSVTPISFGMTGFHALTLISVMSLKTCAIFLCMSELYLFLHIIKLIQHLHFHIFGRNLLGKLILIYPELFLFFTYMKGIGLYIFYFVKMIQKCLVLRINIIFCCLSRIYLHFYL